MAWRPILFRNLVVAACFVAAVSAPAGAAETQAPPPLSAEPGVVDVSSTYGSGSFGSWTVDRFGLPAYRYGIDEETDSRAVQPELSGRPDVSGGGGRRDAWHQVGNDRTTAIALNHGYVQLWSMERLYQWTNLYQPAERHFSGGYGYLNVGGRVLSTLYDDRPEDGTSTREFGLGYVRKQLRSKLVNVDEFVYAPFGDDPVLLHDVTITNTSSRRSDVSWFEYWDVNPAIQTGGPRSRGHLSPTYDEELRTLAVDQLPADGDGDPLSIYGAALSGPVSGYETDTASFFGSGDRARPEAVAADRAKNSIAPPTPNDVAGRTLFSFRSPLRLRPHQRVRLRFAYGTAHRVDIAPLVRRYRASVDPLAESMSAWAGWVPKLTLPGSDPWVARELQWSAYRVRSSASFEEECGYHILPEGGYYLYEQATQGIFRSALDASLSLIYSDPELVREVIRYSAHEQPEETGAVPWQLVQLCTRNDPGTAGDLDFWLLLAATEYAFATRDFDFFDELVPYYSGASAEPLWEHLKLAYFHQETLVGRGPHGGYLAGTLGDWSDLSPAFSQLTESMLIPAQLAYVYPRLALIADARGDSAFAAELRADAEELKATLRGEWTGLGWFSRGYSGTRRLGAGVPYMEPQPWALLAGVPTQEQSATLVNNIRRFLTGHGAPGGPSRIGSAQSPAINDPDITETDPCPFCTNFALGGGNAVFPGGVWYMLNGHLVWALTSLDGVVPQAREFALDEFVRNTLANHAAAFPDHWNGTISSDDACWPWYSVDPSRCAIGLPSFDHYSSQIITQPSWNLVGATRLAGIEATEQGYRFDPHLPFEEFSLRLPLAGVGAEPGRTRGYVRPEDRDDLVLEVAVPAAARDVKAWVDSKSVALQVVNGYATFSLSAPAGSPTDWAVTWQCSAGAEGTDGCP